MVLIPNIISVTKNQSIDFPENKGKTKYCLSYGSVVKSIDCFNGGPEFKSQQPRGDSLSSIMRSGALFGLQAYLEAECCIHNK